MGFFDNNGLVDLLKNYLKTQFELVKLDIQERLEALVERIVKFIILAFALGIGVLFLLHSIAIMINAYLGSPFWGHLIVSGACFIVGAILVASFRRPLENEALEEEEITADESDNREESEIRG